MSARDELLDALLAERYNGGGWKTPERVEVSTALVLTESIVHDDELTTARRRRLLVEAHEALESRVARSENPALLTRSERHAQVESGQKSGPESAPTDRGLATVSTRPKGA